MNRYEMRQPALFIPNRRHGNAVPEWGAIFAVVQHLDGGGMPFAHGFIEFIHGFTIRARALDEPQIFPDNGLRRISRQALEALVHIHYRPPGLLRIRDGDAFRGGRHGAVEKTHLLFRAFARRDIAKDAKRALHNPILIVNRPGESGVIPAGGARIFRTACEVF